MPFKPMLAGKADLSKLTYPVVVSPKLDGVRAVVVDGIVMSRSLKPIPSPTVQALFGRQSLNGVDGELIIGSPKAQNVYNRTVSGVMSKSHLEPKERGSLKFFTFDTFDEPDLPYHERRSRLQGRQTQYARMLMSVTVNSRDKLEQLEQDYLAQGFEGIMLRHPNGIYKYGRSTAREGHLLKLKRFEDSEAEVLGVAELFRNTNEAQRNELGYMTRSSQQAGKIAGETLGALQVRDVVTGVEFEIGTGFSQEERDYLWRLRKHLPGRFVKYKFQPTGVKERPRFPVYLGFRDPIDR